MLIKTRGIIFRAVKYSETSIIADIYTEEKGLRSYIISGVRSKRARVKASLLQVMTLIDMVAYHREDKELTRIKEIKAAHVYSSTPFDITKGAVGLFMVEVARKSIQESEENLPLFNFLFESFEYLDQTTESVANIHLCFLLQLSVFLGFMPGGNYSQKTPFFDLKEGYFVQELSDHLHFLKEEQSQILSQLMQTDLKTCHQVKMTRQQRKDLLHELVTYYRLHIENFPTINAHQILEEVLEG